MRNIETEIWRIMAKRPHDPAWWVWDSGNRDAMEGVFEGLRVVVVDGLCDWSYQLVKESDKPQVIDTIGRYVV